MPVTKVGVEMPIRERVWMSRASEPGRMQGAEDAERDADRKRQDRRDEDELDRRRQAFRDERRHGTLVAVADAEVAGDDPAEEAAILHDDGLVEAEGACASPASPRRSRPPAP